MKPEPERTEKVEIVWAPYRIRREWGLWTHTKDAARTYQSQYYLGWAQRPTMAQGVDHQHDIPCNMGKLDGPCRNLVSNLDHISPLLAVVVVHVMRNFVTTLSTRISWWLVQMTKVLIHTMQFWCSIKIVPPCRMLEVFVGHEALAFNDDHPNISNHQLGVISSTIL
jgi:hypothetical protein